MILQFLAGLLIGGAITWFVAHVYYRKANADQSKIYSKLSKDMRDAILQDRRTELSAIDLNELQKQKAIEARRIDWEKIRRPIYAEALEIVYEIENNRGNVDALEDSRKKLCKWYPSKASYIPPKGTEAIFGVITWGAAYYADLHNRETEATVKTRSLFRDSLQAAKLFFGNLEDIMWLPEDREQKK